MNETEQFAQEVDNILDKPLTEEPAKEPEVGNQDEEPEEEPKNRYERRLQSRLQKEREANIELSTRLQVLSEARQLAEEAPDYLKSVEKIYGTDSPEATAATELLKTALRTVEERATSNALERFRQEQREESAQVQEENDTLDSYIEQLEDAHDITMTKEMQKSYFSLLHKMSPKDADGEILAYADPEAVYEVFAEKLQKRTDNRAKDLASRSMVQGNTAPSKIEDDAAKRLLREAGII